MLRTALDGQRFGKLTVVDQEFAYRLQTSGRKRLALCACECGRERLVLVSNLRSGNTTNRGESLCSTRGDSLRKLYGYLRPGDQARTFIFSNCRAVAGKHGREWEITFERFCELTSQDSHYCGAPPGNRTRDRNGEGAFVYSGLDRVDSSRGYTDDNVVPACKSCNQAKETVDVDEFRARLSRKTARETDYEGGEEVATPYHHAVSSARRWGGEPDDYVLLHEWFDQTKSYHGDFRHRALRHHTHGVFECERTFGRTLTLSNCRVIPVRWVAEQHVVEDLGRIPTLGDWLSCIKAAPWMTRSRRLSAELEGREEWPRPRGTDPGPPEPVVDGAQASRKG